LLVSREDVISRLYKIGSGAAAIGAIHVLALLLNWYVQVIDGSEIPIEGWVIPEARLLSLAGGLLAGVGVVLMHFVRKLRSMKLALGGMIVIGGILSILSPIYSYVFKLSALVSYPRLEIGFFAAVFTGVIQLGVGALAFLTPVAEEALPPTPAPITPMIPGEGAPAPPTPPSRRTTARLVPIQDLEEGICSLCFEPITQGDGVRCSNCDAVFHRGCIETWVSVNGICPNRKAIITGR